MEALADPEEGRRLSEVYAVTVRSPLLEAAGGTIQISGVVAVVVGRDPSLLNSVSKFESTPGIVWEFNISGEVTGVFDTTMSF